MFLRFKKKTPISRLSEGVEAVVKGQVVGENKLTLSGSQTRCVYYDKISESFEHGPRGRGRRMWVPKNMEMRCSGFFIEDASGRVWVDGNTEGFDVQGGIQESGTLGKGHRKRYMAQMIRSGDKVIIGGLVSKPKASEPADLLVLRPNAKGLLKIIVRATVMTNDK